MFDSMATQLFTALTSALRATSAAASAAVATDDGAHASSSGGGFAWPWRREDLASLMGPALALAVSAAFAAAPPLWFCVVCPAVLGLLAPLLINIGLNQVRGCMRQGQLGTPLRRGARRGRDAARTCGLNG